MASTIEKGDKLQFWRYSPKEIDILLDDGTDIKLDTDRLLSMHIENRYTDYMFPIFSITLGIEQDIYYKILKNKNTCKIHLRIDKYFQGDESVNLSLSRKFINDNYDLILADSNENVMKGVDDSESGKDFSSINKTKTGKIDSYTRQETFYLTKAETISGTKKNVNKIIKNCNVSDIYAYLFTVAGISNVLMGQPDNDTVYDELIIPPMSVTGALKYIDTYYGLYKEGSLIYFDLDYTYVIPYNGKCVAWHQKEIYNTNIIIPTADIDSNSGQLGVLYKKTDIENNYLIADNKLLSIDENSITNDFINPSNITIIDSDLGDEHEDIAGDAKSRTEDGFKRIATNPTENKFYGTTYVHQHALESTVVNLVIQNHDVSMLTPNKNFNLIFEDSAYTKKYNGKYVISHSTHNFIKDGDAMKCGSSVTLKKVTEDSIKKHIIDKLAADAKKSIKSATSSLVDTKKKSDVGVSMMRAISSFIKRKK